MFSNLGLYVIGYKAPLFFELQQHEQGRWIWFPLQRYIHAWMLLSHWSLGFRSSEQWFWSVTLVSASPICFLVSPATNSIWIPSRQSVSNLLPELFNRKERPSRPRFGILLVRKDTGRLPVRKCIKFIADGFNYFLNFPLNFYWTGIDWNLQILSRCIGSAACLRHHKALYFRKCQSLVKRTQRSRRYQYPDYARGQQEWFKTLESRFDRRSQTIRL